MKQFLFLLLFAHTLLGHGFGSSTSIVLACQSDKSISYICNHFKPKEYNVISFDRTRARECATPIILCGKSKASCYIILKLKAITHQEIVCTPTQEFYCATTSQWIPAYKIQTGTKLRCRHGTTEVIDIQLIDQYIPIYTIKIPQNHNFYVTNHAVLTYNMVSL